MTSVAPAGAWCADHRSAFDRFDSTTHCQDAGVTHDDELALPICRILSLSVHDDRSHVSQDLRSRAARIGVQTRRAVVSHDTTSVDDFVRREFDSHCTRSGGDGVRIQVASEFQNILT